MTAQSNYARQVKYRINKKLKGLCLAGGCNEPSSYMCFKHLAKAREYNRRAYGKRKANSSVEK